jgi:transposase
MDYFIKEHKWKQIFLRLRKRKDIRTQQEDKLRRYIEAIWYIMRSGCQWRLLPPHYGSWRAVHRRFKRWSDRGIWTYLFEHTQKDPDCETFMIDATIVRAHSCSAGYKKNSQDQQSLGRSKGGFTTKIHAIVDALGNPIRFILTPGQRHDVTQAQALTQNIQGSFILADKGYDSDDFIEFLQDKGCQPVIPPRKNRQNPREYDQHLYKERHLIECFFNKIKHFRRIFSRFDKIATVFTSFLQFASTLIWLR